MAFVPRRVYFEKDAIKYPVGKKLFDIFCKKPETDVQFLKSHNRVTGIPGNTPKIAYEEGKNTLVVGIRKTLKFETCKPSAHYQLPLVTGCMGQCEYCYLNTRFGKKPYIRIYVNIDEILSNTARYIKQRIPDITVFEGAATSDPVPVEPYTGALATTIDFFARNEFGRFRFVTKYTDIDSLLDINHNRKTTIRFSINAEQVIKEYEHFTPSLRKRMETAKKVALADYPLGFIIGPVILFDKWKEQYSAIIKKLKKYLADRPEERIRFEVISHRFTSKAKKTIMEVFPGTTLPMEESERKFKYGQFGYGKYVYLPADIEQIRTFFTQELQNAFPNSTIDYII